MPKAIWNEVIIAESDHTEIVEGNHYFPPDSIKREFFQPNQRTSICPWKGIANYYDVQVNGQTNPSAAFFYATPKPAAANIAAYVAFWRGVEIVE